VYVKYIISVREEMGWLLVVVPGVIWGASFLFIAEGLQAVAPMGVTFVRIAIGFVTLSLVPSARGPIVRGDRLKTALLGILWLAFPLSRVAAGLAIGFAGAALIALPWCLESRFVMNR
jgi:drug/metabolite transporter (DMT)-like permease